MHSSPARPGCLLREYLPKSTDLSAWTPAQLQAIADELNDRPRKRFGYHTPREQLAKQARPVGNAHRGRPGSACR